jgi:hypothetical protein
MTKEEYKEACANLIARDVKPTVPEVLPLVRFYCSLEEAEGLGGCLHIFVEDGNCDDGNIKGCREFAKEMPDKGELGFPICDVLLKMTKTQRKSIYGAGYEGPFEPEPQQPSSEIDWTSDSVRLLGNGERVKCMVIMDVTVMNELQKHEFVNRSLAALTALGADIMKIEPGEKSRIILPN